MLPTQEEMDQAHAQLATVAAVAAAAAASPSSPSSDPTSDPTAAEDVHHHHHQQHSPSQEDLHHVLDPNDEAVQALIKAATAQYNHDDPAAVAESLANVIEQAKKAAAQIHQQQQQLQHQQQQQRQHQDNAATSSSPSSTTLDNVIATAGASQGVDLTALAGHDSQELLHSLIPAAVAAVAAMTSSVSSASPVSPQSSSGVIPDSPLLETGSRSNNNATAPSKPKKSKSSSSSSGASSSSAQDIKPYVSTKTYNKDDIFCLGCCRNLSVDHYKDAKTDRLFKSCNACRQKSRLNSKKVVKPTTIPVQPTISMEEFGDRLRQLEDDEDESVLDVMVRLEGSTDMDPETLKGRGAAIANQVYESTGYWFSHSRTNDETQSKTRLKIYGCSQREDRRAPPAPKTQSRKRNRPSTKVYFPCKGNLTMTFYHQLHQVRVVYSHRRHAKYDNRKCPDHVRQFVKDNLSQPPRVLYESLMQANPGLGITQAQVRYWSHHFKKNGDQDDNEDDEDGEGASSRKASRSTSVQSPSAGSKSNMDVEMSTRDGSPSTTGLPELTEQQALEQIQREQHEQVHEHVQELLRASNITSIESLAAAQQSVLSAAAAAAAAAAGLPVPVPIASTDMDESSPHSPLTSSIVQSVLAEDGGNGLLELQARLVSAASNGDFGAIHHHHQHDLEHASEDIVVQQVSAFMKENDRHLLALQRQQEQHQLEQQQQQQLEQQQQTEEGSDE